MSTTTDDRHAHLIDLPTLARWLGVNHRHIRRLVAERRIPYLTWGHLLRFDPVEIQTWLDTTRHPAQRRPHGVPGLPGLPGQKAS